ncbi:MAG: hypothetical protein IJ642_12070 [Oscillospiraceae bacterium]|nr:hypothetical protein [Oscillospiraceae bacterium]
MQLKELLRVIKSDENLLISDAHFGIDRLFDSKDNESALVFKTYVLLNYPDLLSCEVVQVTHEDRLGIIQIEIRK